MNLLAHFYLSGESPELRVGNFVGDSVKGTDFSQFPEKIAEGIKMHREIDYYADTHQVTQDAKRLLSRYRHYSSVIIDIFYDHFLAKNWKEHHDKELGEYVIGVYQDLGRYKEHFPRKSKKMYRYMIQYNWLETYASVEGISRVLHGMSKRTIFKSKMEKASEELVMHYQEFEQAFNDFFPEIIKETNKYRV